MTEPQPEYVWAHPETGPRRGRAWLIVILAIAAVAIAVAVFWLFLRPGAPLAQPTPTSTASPSASPAVSPTASPSDGPAATGTPEPTAVSTPPPAPDPDLATFRDRVSPVLADARRGFQIAADSDAQEAAQTIGFLQDDAERLAGTVAPDAIASRWSASVTDYAKALQSLRSAYERDAATDREVAAATSALSALEDIVEGR